VKPKVLVQRRVRRVQNFGKITGRVKKNRAGRAWSSANMVPVDPIRITLEVHPDYNGEKTKNNRNFHRDVLTESLIMGGSVTPEPLNIEIS